MDLESDRCHLFLCIIYISVIINLRRFYFRGKVIETDKIKRYIKTKIPHLMYGLKYINTHIFSSIPCLVHQEPTVKGNCKE